MRSESWLRAMSGLVLLGVFGAGTVFGVGVMRWRAPLVERPHGPPSPFEAMERELGLDGKQVATLQRIAAAHHDELTTITRDTQTRVRDVLHAIEERLRPDLRPDQIERLESWRARRPPPGLPRPPGPGPDHRGPP
jgi:hypothetical protein